jgi:hypothetical protein
MGVRSEKCDMKSYKNVGKSDELLTLSWQSHW